ncbi:MAG: Dabb family protein [Chitinophagaceae bacterium]|nr:MAG: Dabb family protein [Chitinophagaceae bacterium]
MKKQDRRQFISTAAVIAAAPALITSSFMEPTSSQVVHHVFFWLKNPGSATDRKELIEGLKTLTGIKEIKKLLIGTPASTEKREVVDNSYDVSELMYFDSVKDQDAYQVHPIHKAFVEKYSHLWAKVVVYDMLVV